MFSLLSSRHYNGYEQVFLAYYICCFLVLFVLSSIHLYFVMLTDFFLMVFFLFRALCLEEQAAMQGKIDWDLLISIEDRDNNFSPLCPKEI